MLSRQAGSISVSRGMTISLSKPVTRRLSFASKPQGRAVSKSQGSSMQLYKSAPGRPIH
jgi:hypothetical protein